MEQDKKQASDKPIWTSRFTDVTVFQSCYILLALCAVLAAGVFLAPDALPERRRATSPDRGDAALYEAIAQGLRNGQGYYETVGTELRSRNYATRPFFNWRLPTLAVFLALLPTEQMGRWLLALLASATVLTWVAALKTESGFTAAAVGGTLFVGIVPICVASRAFLWHEIWAGALIALSIAAGRFNRPLSVAAGIAALCIRELALPFAAVMLVTALVDKRRREALAWLGGIAVFLVYLGIHARVVSGLLTDSEMVNQTWLQCGGWPFVLSTARWTFFTTTAPPGFIALFLLLGIFGAIGRPGLLGLRVAGVLVAYALAFSIAGRVDNSYWGLVYAPLIPLAVAWAVPALRDLARRALHTPHSPVPK